LFFKLRLLFAHVLVMELLVSLLSVPLLVLHLRPLM
jgi:hypothetical protein